MKKAEKIMQEICDNLIKQHDEKVREYLNKKMLEGVVQ